MVAFKLWPALVHRDNFVVNEPMALRCVFYFLLCMYMTLVCLNFFWLYKIFTGALKALKKPKDDKEKTG